MATLNELIALHCSGVENYTDIAAILNAPTYIDNPLFGQETVSETFTQITMNDIISKVPPEEAAVIYTKSPTLITNMQQAIDAVNRPWLGYLLQVAITDTIGAFSEDTKIALATLLESKNKVTSVQPEKIIGPSIAVANGFGRITNEQIQGALSNATIK